MLSLFIILVGINFVSAETYDISEAEFEAGYTQDLTSSGRINFPIDGETRYISMTSIFIDSAEIHIFANDRQFFNSPDHPGYGDAFTNEYRFEMTKDNYYDVLVTLNSAIINVTFDENNIRSETRVASVTIKKINEEIPEGTEIFYECWKWHTCWDDSKFLYCDYSGSGRCGCSGINPTTDCPPREQPTCEKHYTCEDGTQVKECESVAATNGQGGGCGCIENPEELCPTNEDEEEETPEIICPNIIPPASNFCEQGEIKTQYDDNNCIKGYKCMKKLSNGRDAEIKVMPETASQTAIDKLGELEFEIELKEVGSGNEAKVVYEAKAKKQGRFLGLFKVKAEVITQIDSDTGEIIFIKKPWWSFLASGI